MKRRLRGLRRLFAPQRLDEIVGGDDLVSVKQQESEERAVLPARGGVRSTPSASTSSLPSSRNSTFVPIVARRRASRA